MNPLPPKKGQEFFLNFLTTFLNRHSLNFISVEGLPEAPLPCPRCDLFLTHTYKAPHGALSPSDGAISPREPPLPGGGFGVVCTGSDDYGNSIQNYIDQTSPWTISVKISRGYLNFTVISRLMKSVEGLGSICLSFCWSVSTST